MANEIGGVLAFYSVFNYEILNTLYFFKTRNYFKFFKAIVKRFHPKFVQCSNRNLLTESAVNESMGYSYKAVNLKIFIYDLLLFKIK